MLILKRLGSNTILVVDSEKTHRRRQCLSNIPGPAFAQDRAEESSINKPLTGSKQGSEERDVEREPNHVHDRIGDESDGSNRQMD